VAIGAAEDVRVEDRELELRQRAVDLERSGRARTLARCIPYISSISHGIR
jgi:hypothetical protein